MNDHNTTQRELTEEEKKNPVSSGAVEWHDPLDKPVAEHENPTGKLAVASVSLGIAGICVACAPPAAVILGVSGLTCGILSFKKHESADKLRIAGIIFSAAALIIGLILFVMNGVFHNATDNVEDYYKEVEESLGV